MAQKLTVFDESWLRSAGAKEVNTSWVDNVMSTADSGGDIYLDSLRTWFDRFPLLQKGKRDLKARLESFIDTDHLGAVNELSWWALMRQMGWQSDPIPASKSPRPDFRVRIPVAFLVEVSTLNVSNADRKTFAAAESVELNHSATLKPILFKITDEKKEQISYAADQKQPCLLVLFDYTTWSGFGTQCFQFLAEFLVGEQLGFGTLPRELAALVYVERRVIDGRIAVSRDRTAIYYNPIARYPLSVGRFPAMRAFSYQMMESEPELADDPWIWL